MIRYALGNLLAKKVRTILSLALLVMVLAGTIGLISLSSGMRESVSSSLRRVEGIVVIAKGSADPLFSHLPLSIRDDVLTVDGVVLAVPEVWGMVNFLDGHSPLTKGWFSAVAYGGLDTAAFRSSAGEGLYAKSIESGRFVRAGDKRTAVLSRKLSREYGKGLNDTVEINGRTFTVVGIYHTGSLFLDQSIVMTIEDARHLSNLSVDSVSTVYVETDDLSEERIRDTARRIDSLSERISAKTRYDWHQEFGTILFNLDAFFTAQSVYIAVLGVVVVLLTMTMSVMERQGELGILKAVGWTRGNIARLVILESLLLGAVAGAFGCGVGVASAWVLGRFLPYPPLVPPLLIAVTFTAGLVIGLIGGLYPALKAASLNPVEAIRTQ